MSILKVTTDEEILHKISKPVTEFDARLAGLLDDMHETLKKQKGVGIAAVQVSVLYRACLVETPQGIAEFINPVLTPIGKEKVGEEGCLSVPRTYVKIKRNAKVFVRAQNRRGELFETTLEKMAAVCIQHEVDHMNGITITDRAAMDKKA